MVNYPIGSDGYNKRARSRHTDRTGRKPFAGVDGEGGNRDGSHHYFLLRAGSRELYNADNTPLTTAQCLGFLADLPNTHNYVGFFFDYDTTMILRDLSLERVGRLLKPKTFVGPDGRLRQLPCDWHEFQVMYRPSKYLMVRRRLAVPRLVKRSERVPDSERLPGGRKTRPTEVEVNYGEWVTISDVGSFFQCTFVRALEEWLGEWDGEGYSITDNRTRDIVDRIAEGKKQRNEFTGLNDYIREYCALECQELAKLMERFRDNAAAVGLNPTRWQGPGYLVSAAMRRNKFPRNEEYKDNAPQTVWDMAQSAYYGGRFEAPIIGRVDQPVYQYDINSAYAGVYGSLPCLIHGEWRSVDPATTAPIPHLSLMRGSFYHRRGEHVCALPVRDKNGGIYFPERGQGTYWFFELNAAADRINFKPTEIWSYHRTCDCKPFRWVQALYDERMRVGKKTGMGGILKLTLASTYGKLCQSIGMAPYSNPVWASLITASVRSQLYTAAIGEHDGRDVVMLATDGLFTLNERPRLLISKAIGEWERDIHDSMFVIQSGLYFLPGKEPKSRGVPRAKVNQQREAIIASWERFLPALRASRHPDKLDPASCPVYLDQFIGITQAYAWNDMSRGGQWHQDHERKITFDWRAKRRTGRRSNLRGGMLVTRPHRGSRDETNHAYDKNIGGMVDGIEHSARKEINDGQPDWNHFQL